MNLTRKYDQTLRRKYSFRAVWLPGTDIKVGDILILKDGALVSVGNIGNHGIPFEEEVVAEMDSLDIKSTGVSKSLLQNGSKVSFNKLDTSAEVELKLNFNTANSYFLKTPKLKGKGMVSALEKAHEIAKLKNWDFKSNYVVHQVYSAKDFVFLGSATKGSFLTLKGSADAVRNFITGGAGNGIERTGSRNLGIEVTDEGGPVMMRLIRIKRNGEIY